MGDMDFVKDNSAFPGLALCHVKNPLSPEFLEKAREHLLMYPYTQLVEYPRTEDRPAPFCLWVSEKGEWFHMLTKEQQNAFIPYTFPEWLRGMAISANKTLSAHTLGKDFTLYPNAALVTWWQGQDHRYAPLSLRARGEEGFSPSHRRMYIYIGERPALMCVTAPDVTENCLRIPLNSGDVISYNGAAREKWDLTLARDLDKEPFRGDEQCFLIEFQNIHPLMQAQAERLRPVQRTEEGILRQTQAVPRFPKKLKLDDADDDDDDDDEMPVPVIDVNNSSESDE